jgi:uncharacterized membrane protein
MATNGNYRGAPHLWPGMGCMGMALVLFFLCLMPFFLLDTMKAALHKLHLPPEVAGFAIFGILIGGLVNIPVHRIERLELQPVDPAAVFGFWMPRFRRFRRDTVIAVNLGGCIVPAAIAAWEAWHIFDEGGWPLTVMAIAATANVVACYSVARPMQGVGITMPGLVSPAVSVGVTWLLLLDPVFNPVRAPVAFVAGIAGPLVGADLLHLKDITRVSAGVLSIGGAGTFDGIVLSGILAALLA